MAFGSMPHCSFCGKNKNEVDQLIAADDANQQRMRGTVHGYDRRWRLRFD